MERIGTGVNGLDALMEGGYVKGRYHLLAGDAGTGKSTYAMMFCLQAIADGGKCCYVSLEEEADDMSQNLERYGLSVNQAIADGKLLFIHSKPYEIQKMVDSSVNELADRINEFKPDRLVFDSVTTFNLRYDAEGVIRGGMNKLFDIIEGMEHTITSLFTAEAEDRKARFSVEYVMDSVVKLYNIKQGEGRTRALEIFKMRGTDHSKKLHSITLEEGRGMVVHDQGVLINPEDLMF